jgi:hypothetical protein
VASCQSCRRGHHRKGQGLHWQTCTWSTNKAVECSGKANTDWCIKMAKKSRFLFIQTIASPVDLDFSSSFLPKRSATYPSSAKIWIRRNTFQTSAPIVGKVFVQRRVAGKLITHLGFVFVAFVLWDKTLLKLVPNISELVWRGRLVMKV